MGDAETVVSIKKLDILKILEDYYPAFLDFQEGMGKIKLSKGKEKYFPYQAGRKFLNTLTGLLRTIPTDFDLSAIG